jgi:hypothetical protein
VNRRELLMALTTGGYAAFSSPLRAGEKAPAVASQAPSAPPPGIAMPGGGAEGAWDATAGAFSPARRGEENAAYPPVVKAINSSRRFTVSLLWCFLRNSILASRSTGNIHLTGLCIQCPCRVSRAGRRPGPHQPQILTRCPTVFVRGTPLTANGELPGPDASIRGSFVDEKNFGFSPLRRDSVWRPWRQTPPRQIH